MECRERSPEQAGPSLRLVSTVEASAEHPLAPGSIRLEGDPAAIATFIRSLVGNTPAAPAPIAEARSTTSMTPPSQDATGRLGPTAAALVDAYAAERSGDCTSQHVAEVRGLVRDLLAHAGVTDPMAITRQNVVEFLTMCETVGRVNPWQKGRRKCSAKTRRNMLTALRVFYGWLIEAHGASIANPCATVRSPRVVRKQMRAFTAGEAAAIIAEARTLERATLYRVLWVSGVRVGAIAGQKYRAALPDAYFETAAVPPRVVIPAEFSKTGQAYTCAIDAETASMIDRLRMAKGPTHGPSLPLFRRPRPKAFFGDLKRAGVAIVDARGRRAGLHCFRRGAATGMLDLGLDAKTAQLQLGHTDVATTLRHYTDRGLREQGTAAELLGRALGTGKVGEA